MQDCYNFYENIIVCSNVLIEAADFLDIDPIGLKKECSDSMVISYEIIIFIIILIIVVILIMIELVILI